MSTDPVIHEALTRAVPLRTELTPAWGDVLARADRRPRRHRAFRSRWVFAAAATAAAGLSVGGLAIAGVIGSAPLHEAKLDVPATTLASGLSTCDLINISAADVAAKLTSAGIAVEWRYTRWGTTVASPPTGSSPGVVTGGSSDPVSSVPGDSVVWNVSPDGSSKAIVSVEAANDPRAPTVSVEGCSS